MRLPTIILAIASPINILLNIWLVHFTDMRVLGSAMALTLTYWLSFILLGVATATSAKHKENGTWGGLQIRAALDFESCVSFWKLAIPGIIMVETEW